MSSTSQADSAIFFPILRYPDNRRTLQWLNETLGLHTHLQVPGPDDSIRHGQMTMGQGMLMLSAGMKAEAANPWCNETHGIYVYVPDIEAQYRRAEAGGATIMSPLRDTEYGSREFSIRDLAGHAWSFGTYQPWRN